MRKFTTSLMGVLMLLAACNKKATQLDEVQADPQEQVTERHCAAQEILDEQMAADPNRRAYIDELERKTETFAREHAGMRVAGTLYVPVWVNVVLPNPSQVSDAQIKTQIDVLNRDFNATNAELSNPGVYLAGYPYNNVANCQVTFVMMGRTNKANSATPTWGTNDAVKKTASGGQDPTNPTTYLNLWACDLSSGLLGYAQFPGGSVATDGVVIVYQAFCTTASYPMYSVFNLG